MKHDMTTAEGWLREENARWAGPCPPKFILDMRDLLSTLDELRRSFDERGKVLEALGQGETTCAWTEDEDGVWHTGCGRAWCFEAGGPTANRVAYCPYCGKGLEVSK